MMIWKTGTAAALLMVGVLIGGMGGCMKFNKGPEMSERLKNAPPIRLDDSQDVHILVMQAPNPGWSFWIERDERTRDGMRVYLTMRRPDPTMLYPQVIVEKNLRTGVRTETPIQIYGRVLEFEESTRGRGHALIKPVDSFQE